MPENLISIIRKIDLVNLHRLVGNVILKAIQMVNKGEDETALAEILVLKYGNLILNKKEIRLGVLNSLSPTNAVFLCTLSGISVDKDFKAYGELENFLKMDTMK